MPYVGIVVAAPAVPAGRIGVDQVGIIGHGEAEEPQGPVLRHGDVQLDLAIIVIVLARRGLDAAREARGVRARRHELDGPADVGAAVEYALRPLQHLDALEVAEAGRGVAKELHIIQVEAHPLGVAEGPQSAHGHIGEAVQAPVHKEIRHQQAQVFQAVDVGPFRQRAGKSRQGFGYLQRVFLPLAGGDDDLLQERLPLRPCRRGRQEQSQRQGRGQRHEQRRNSQPPASCRCVIQDGSQRGLPRLRQVFIHRKHPPFSCSNARHHSPRPQSDRSGRGWLVRQIGSDYSKGGEILFARQ